MLPVSKDSLLIHTANLWQRLGRFGRRHQLPATEGNAVRLLRSGGQILEAIRSLMDGAQATIHFEIYTWADDATGRDLLARLRSAERRGIRIRGIVDYVGSWEALAMIRAAGLDIRFYHPLSWSLPFRAWQRRNHRKLIIVDGTRAVVGSANWTDEYDDEVPPKYYRDLGLEVQGPALAHLELDFRKSWLRVAGLVPEDPPAWKGAPVGPGWIDEVPIQIVSSLHGGGRILRRHLILLLGQLETRAIIANAYFIPDPSFLRVLLRMARRGVKVDLIAPGISDHAFVQAASRATFGRLLRAGVDIWERRERVFHAKVAVLDSELVLVGTANLDSASFRHNLELNLMIRSSRLGTELQAALDEDMAQACHLAVATWQALPRWRRAIQWFAYLFWWWL